MGISDRIIRLLLAALFIYLYFGGIVTGIIGIIMVVLGAIFVLTSLIGFCPLYMLAGINTCSSKKKQQVEQKFFSLNLSPRFYAGFIFYKKP